MRADALIDTNVLVYRYDYRFPQKQEIATALLRHGIAKGSVRLPHQAIVEFVAAVTRPVRGHAILPLAEALREAEEFLKQFVVLYPLRTPAQ
jgi:predicted nucleic acid-binding protein